MAKTPKWRVNVRGRILYGPVEDLDGKEVDPWNVPWNTHPGDVAYDKLREVFRERDDLQQRVADLERERDEAHLARIVAQNPGIDPDEVRDSFARCNEQSHSIWGGA